jgi:hypothetical protein
VWTAVPSFSSAIPRHYGVLGTFAHISPLYAQARLYVDERVVAPNATQLQRAYRARYGWELTTGASRETYFRSTYQAVCGVIDGLRGRHDGYRPPDERLGDMGTSDS